MAKNVARIQFATPPGVLQWPKLNKINYGTARFKLDKGNFETGIVIDTSHKEFDKFAKEIESYYPKAKELAEAKFAALPVKNRKELLEKNPGTGIRLRPLIQPMYDEQTEELLSTVKLKIKVDADVTTKAGKTWMNRPTAFSASLKPLPLFINAPNTPHHGKPHPKAREIYTGTLARVNFELEMSEWMIYFAPNDGTYGLKPALRGVQILQYADAPQRGAAAYGFTAEQGYDGEDVDDSWSEDDFASTTPASEGSGEAGEMSGDF